MTVTVVVERRIDGVNDGRRVETGSEDQGFKVINTHPPRYGGQGVLNGHQVRENIFCLFIAYNHPLLLHKSTYEVQH